MPAQPLLISALALALLVGAAPDPQAASDRYKMLPTDGGALRLDTQTGAVSICQRKAGAWSCSGIAEDSKALQAEIDRLSAENKQLQSAVRRLEELIGLPDPDAKGPRVGRGSSKFQLPSEEEVDRAMTYMQRMMRLFKQKWRDLDEDRRSM